MMVMKILQKIANELQLEQIFGPFHVYVTKEHFNQIDGDPIKDYPKIPTKIIAYGDKIELFVHQSSVNSLLFQTFLDQLNQKA